MSLWRKIGDWTIELLSLWRKWEVNELLNYWITEPPKKEKVTRLLNYRIIEPPKKKICNWIIELLSLWRKKRSLDYWIIEPPKKKSERPVDALAVKKRWIADSVTTWNQLMLVHLKMGHWIIELVNYWASEKKGQWIIELLSLRRKKRSLYNWNIELLAYFFSSESQ